MHDVRGGVHAVLSEVLGVPLSEIAPESDLESDLGMDSLKMIETNVALEVKFGFVSPDVARPEELQIRTVADLVGYVTGQVEEQRGRQ
jgi:acyl carrier protein